MKRKYIMAVIIALMLGTVATMADDKEKYQQLAEQVRTEVWSKELPAFSQRERIGHRSSYASLQWTITGSFNSPAISSCFRKTSFCTSFGQKSQ